MTNRNSEEGAEITRLGVSLLYGGTARIMALLEFKPCRGHCEHVAEGALLR